MVKFGMTTLWPVNLTLTLGASQPEDGTVLTGALKRSLDGAKQEGPMYGGLMLPLSGMKDEDLELWTYDPKAPREPVGGLLL